MTNIAPQFSIHPTTGMGFIMRFKNGYTISVQFSNTNYCANSILRKNVVSTNTCKDAEVAVIDPLGVFVKLRGEDVMGFVSPDEVASLITKYSSMKVK